MGIVACLAVAPLLLWVPRLLPLLSRRIFPAPSLRLWLTTPASLTPLAALAVAVEVPSMATSPALARIRLARRLRLLVALGGAGTPLKDGNFARHLLAATQGFAPMPTTHEWLSER